MGLTKTMLQEDINQLTDANKSRNAIVELFYQRLYNFMEHIKYDINSLRENTIIPLEDLKDLYMVTDMYAIQVEEIVDKIKADPCEHINISGANGNKICSNCGAKIS
jgi:hypothetical protein